MRSLLNCIRVFTRLLSAVLPRPADTSGRRGVALRKQFVMTVSEGAAGYGALLFRLGSAVVASFDTYVFVGAVSDESVTEAVNARRVKGVVYDADQNALIALVQYENGESLETAFVVLHPNGSYQVQTEGASEGDASQHIGEVGKPHFWLVRNGKYFVLYEVQGEEEQSTRAVVDGGSPVTLGSFYPVFFAGIAKGSELFGVVPTIGASSPAYAVHADFNSSSVSAMPLDKNAVATTFDPSDLSIFELKMLDTDYGFYVRKDRFENGFINAPEFATVSGIEHADYFTHAVVANAGNGRYALVSNFRSPFEGYGAAIVELTQGGAVAESAEPVQGISLPKGFIASFGAVPVLGECNESMCNLYAAEYEPSSEGGGSGGQEGSGQSGGEGSGQGGSESGSSGEGGGSGEQGSEEGGGQGQGQNLSGAIEVAQFPVSVDKREIANGISVAIGKKVLVATLARVIVADMQSGQITWKQRYDKVLGALIDADSGAVKVLAASGNNAVWVIVSEDGVSTQNAQIPQSVSGNAIPLLIWNGAVIGINYKNKVVYIDPNGTLHVTDCALDVRSLEYGFVPMAYGMVKDGALTAAVRTGFDDYCALYIKPSSGDYLSVSLKSLVNESVTSVSFTPGEGKLYFKDDVRSLYELTLSRTEEGTLIPSAQVVYQVPRDIVYFAGGIAKVGNYIAVLSTTSSNASVVLIDPSSNSIVGERTLFASYPYSLNSAYSASFVLFDNESNNVFGRMTAVTFDLPGGTWSFGGSGGGQRQSSEQGGSEQGGDSGQESGTWSESDEGGTWSGSEQEGSEPVTIFGLLYEIKSKVEALEQDVSEVKQKLDEIDQKIGENQP